MTKGKATNGIGLIQGLKVFKPDILGKVAREVVDISILDIESTRLFGQPFAIHSLAMYPSHWLWRSASRTVLPKLVQISGHLVALSRIESATHSHQHISALQTRLLLSQFIQCPHHQSRPSLLALFQLLLGGIVPAIRNSGLPSFHQLQFLQIFHPATSPALQISQQTVTGGGGVASIGELLTDVGILHLAPYILTSTARFGRYGPATTCSRHCSCKR